MPNRAMVFSGQGAQTMGMGRDLYDTIPECKALFDAADDALGFALSTICFEGPEEVLTRSDNCQPAIFVTSLACCTALKAKGVDTDVVGMAGLSLGEWTALHAAGVLTFEDTLKALQARGRFMQEACEATAGGMISIIGLGREPLDAICAETGATIANLNSEAQIVLSGPRDAIARAETLANEAGAKRAIVLKVAGAFHSPLMQPAADRLETVLQDIEFHAPRCPVIANVTGAPHGGPDEIRATMVRQVTGSVHWLDSIQWFQAQGTTAYIECGPGRVLTGLIKRIDSTASLHNIQGIESLEKESQALA